MLPVLPLLLSVAASLPGSGSAAPHDAFLEDGTRLGLPPIEPPAGSVIAHFEPRLGVPTFVWGDRADVSPSPKSRGLSATAAAIEAFVAHAPLYRLTPSDVALAKVVSVIERPEGPVVVTFGVEINRVPVLRNQLEVLMTHEYRMVAISGYLSPRSFVRPAGFRLSRAVAIRRAASDLGVAHVGARARATYFVLADRLEPAYEVELADEVRIVSAADGRVLYRASLSFAHGYRVYADLADADAPSDDPSGGSMSPHPTGHFEAIGEGATSQVYVERAGWLSPSATDLVGPFVSAYVDQTTPDGYGLGDIMPVWNSATGFEYPHDPSVDPRASSEQAAAAAVQLFYTANYLHDVWAEAGFDAGDRVLAEVESTVDARIARMVVPRLGASPRMETFLVEQGPEVAAIGWGSAIYARRYYAGPGGMGPTHYSVTAEVILAEDVGYQGCEPPLSANAYAGKVVLVREGGCAVTVKAQVAEAAGAIAVAVVAAVPAWRTTSWEPAIVGVPVVALLSTEGEDLVAGLEVGETVGLDLVGSNGNRREAAFDATVVAHELGHLASARLVADGVGLSNPQGLALAEGWSDFAALLSMVKADDVHTSAFGGVYAVGGYAADDRYFGARRVPYSSDFNADPLTFGHLSADSPIPNGVPHRDVGHDCHDAGEVWASMLWEGAVAMLRARPDFEQTRARLRMIMVGALRMTPPQPTFLEARDAFLAVALATDPADYQVLLAAFARRGVGRGALAPERGASDFGAVVESFRPDEGFKLIGVRFEQTGSCDADGILDDGESGSLVLTLENLGIGSLAQATVAASASVPGLFVPVAAVSIPGILPHHVGDVSIPISLAGRQSLLAEVSLVLADPTLAEVSTLSATINLNQDAVASLRDDFETERTRWVTAPPPGVEGWGRIRDENGRRAWFVPTPAETAELSLVSPPLAIRKGADFRFAFSHRYAFAPGGDGGVVEVSLDRGLSWFDVGTAMSPSYSGVFSGGKLDGAAAFVGVSPSLPARDQVVVDLGPGYGGRTAMIRFRALSDDASAWWGWDIDEVRVSGVVGLPFNELVAEDHLCIAGPSVRGVTPGRGAISTTPVQRLGR